MPKDTTINRNRLNEFIASQVSNQIRFLKELCNRNSHTYNKGGVDKTAELILDRIEGIFPIHEVKHEKEVGNHHILRTSSGDKPIYLIGHMDTVFPLDHPFQHCILENDLLKGPGTADMKGGLAVLVYALKALAETGVLEKLNLTLILNSDEEIGSEFSSKIFISEREKAAACLCAECAGPEEEIVISRNGKMGIRLDCRGRDRHVSEEYGDKASAVLELAHKVIALEALNDMKTGVRVNVGKIEGGLGPATVPSHAHGLVDVRWRDEKDAQAVLDKIRAETESCFHPGCDCEMKILNSRPAMPEKPENRELFRILQEVASGLGQPFGPEHRQGTSDVNFFAAGGIPSLDGFGPVGFHDHTPKEYIIISSLRARTLLLSHFLIELGCRYGMI